MLIHKLTPKIQPCLNSKLTQNWYVVYTFPKAERKVKDKLESIGINSFLPMHQVIREWSDRKKKLIVPLFPNYIFLKAHPSERHEVFSIKEIIRYVCFEGKPATIKESIIESLQNLIKRNWPMSVQSIAGAGTPVIITEGPFMGTEGIVIRSNGKTRLIVQIRSLQREVVINVSSAEVEAMQA
jgi:transcription antitermination factor NusG